MQIGDESYPAIKDALLDTNEPMIYLPYTEYRAFQS